MPHPTKPNIQNFNGVEYLTRAQAARLLQVSPRTISNAVADGRLPARRIGRLVRFWRADIDRMMSNARIAA